MVRSYKLSARAATIQLSALIACTPTPTPTPTPTATPTPTPTATPTPTPTATATLLPDYLARMERLDEHYDRDVDRSTIIRGPEEDVRVLRSYPRSADKGPLTGSHGERLTIITAKQTYARGEKIRVLHVHEITLPGSDLFVMGPKGIYGEYIDERRASYDSERPGAYDGRVLPSPNVDHNYETSVYDLPAGVHTIQWKLKTLSGTYLESNVLRIEVR